MNYPINEIFQTIQGEGFHTGTPAIFVRLQGCPVGCPWCDTKHTWTVNDENQIPVSDLLAKNGDSEQFSQLTAAAIGQVFIEQNYTARHVVITGGEPAMYDLSALTKQLHEAGYSIQVETSGTFAITCHEATWVTLSPKINMKGGYDILDSCLMRANEIKHPVARERDVEALQLLLARLPEHQQPPVFLQPISQGQRATQLCIDTCIAHNWRLSLQTHKYLGIE